MTIKQISVFLQNEPGRLLAFTEVLSKAGINMSALNLADVTEYGIVRIIVDDVEKAVAVLTENNYTVRVTDILCVDVTDKPGSLHTILDKLAAAQLNISYMYGFSTSNGASLAFKVDDLAKGEAALK